MIRVTISEIIKGKLWDWGISTKWLEQVTVVLSLLHLLQYWLTEIIQNHNSAQIFVPALKRCAFSQVVWSNIMKLKHIQTYLGTYLQFIFLGKISKGVWFYLPIGIMLVISGIMLCLALIEIKKQKNIESGTWKKLLERYCAEVLA